jgi:hypothetical protein
VGQRGSAIDDQLAHERPIDVIEPFAVLRHGRRLSQRTPGAGEPMSAHVQTSELRARFAAALSQIRRHHIHDPYDLYEKAAS